MRTTYHEQKNEPIHKRRRTGLHPSRVQKRSIVVLGHRTSVSIETPFWDQLKLLASRERLTLSDLVGKVECEKQTPNLSSAIRLFVLDQLLRTQGEPRP